MSSHKITLIFMAIALVLFVTVKILPKYKQPKSHVTGRIHVDTSPKKDNEFRKDGLGWFINTDGETLTKVNIELAQTPAQIKKGLSHRKSMEVSNGVLFVFNKVEQQTFWMKDTLMPLDIIFMNESGVVVNLVKHTVPNSLELIKSKVSVKQVLEVNSGFIETNRIELGSKLTFEKNK